MFAKNCDICNAKNLSKEQQRQTTQLLQQPRDSLNGIQLGDLNYLNASTSSEKGNKQKHCLMHRTNIEYNTRINNTTNNNQNINNNLITPSTSAASASATAANLLKSNCTDFRQPIKK